MSIATELSRIQTNRNTIRAKLVELGMASNNDKLDALASAINGLVNQGAVSVTVQEGATYTIPKGYHNGSGTVSGVAGGGNYSLQSKTATPTKTQQNITPDSGYYGLSDVTVAAIPDAFQDVTSVTAGAGDVLTGKVYVTSTGVVTAGTMANIGAASKTLDVATVTYTIPKGYHNGSGKVSITLETKSVTPTKSEQKITPTSGKVLSQVTVAAIPDVYQDVTSVTATAADVLTGKTIVDAEGDIIDGTMPIIKAEEIAMGQTASTHSGGYIIPKGYHDGTGVVKVAATERTVTPSKNTQTLPGVLPIYLSKVTINPIPDEYQDVSEVDAAAADVLNGKKIVASDGTVVTGSMPNNGAVNQTLTKTTISYKIPAGYHDGTGVVKINPTMREVTPTKSNQRIEAGDATVLTNVLVYAIPDEYQDIRYVDCDPQHVLAGLYFVNENGPVEGTMPNNGNVSATIDGITTTSVTIPLGYTSGGTVALTTDIEEALAAI